LFDDDWIIHRILGIADSRWLEVKPIFIRSGWLVVEGGRLFNPLTRRKYLAAQSALSEKP
jgi:hypothetical protein